MLKWLSFLLALAVTTPAAAQTLAVDPSPPPPTESDEVEDVDVYVRTGLWVEQMDLSGDALAFGAPEIEALRGLRLDADWLAQSGLGEQVLGGASLAVGMRGWDFLRGELRFLVGGGDTEGRPLPSRMEGIDVEVASVLSMRLELAAGVEMPFVPVSPYLLVRAAVGAALIDVVAGDARLGRLGTETLDRLTIELGIEAGYRVRFSKEIELALGARGSFLGVVGGGGSLTISFHPDA